MAHTQMPHPNLIPNPKKHSIRQHCQKNVNVKAIQFRSFTVHLFGYFLVIILPFFHPAKIDFQFHHIEGEKTIR